MTGVTQTIDTYYAGMSQQPDLKKFPGQVKDIVNGVPDAIEGLYKRPGAKRIGSAPLANVQSNGSWFHYYRDETEGSYIGQIASNGKVRVWSCNDGTEKNVWYHTDNSAYSGSNSDHTSITSYLTPSSATATEDLQALTINDTTFLNNRTKTVGTTGTTPTRSETHFAFVEILRTENGRQYSLNIYNDETTQGIDRATRLKIQSDTLDESNGSGHCPGIGTQTFSVTSGSKKNLIFRISALGQQGQGAGVDDGGVNASNYKCSYNRQVILLHGGEGWDTGDTATVTLDQAQTSYNYTIRVEDHETINAKMNIKGVRPVPTPFDAETAVTMDTVLAGISSELPGSINYKVIGNGIYLWSSSAFSVEVPEKDLMRVLQESINDVSELPTQCKDGYIVKVANSRDSNDDDYYLKFEGNDGLDGPGAWVECAEPGIVKSLNATTMPHVLQRQADGDFLVKKYTWEDRVVGDDTTNPLPSFVGKKINRVLFFRNRLALLSGESVILSRPGELATPAFFAKTALAVGATDPIDISCSSTFPSDLFDGLEVAAGLVVFSTNQQFLLSSDAEILNPDTAKLRSISTYNYNKDVSPISLGVTTGYIDNSGKYSRFNEMANVVREQEPVVMETSKIVSTLLPKDIDLVTNSRENQLVLFGKTDSDIVYGYKYFTSGEKREQTAWFKWKLNNPIKYHFIIDDEYFLLDTDNFLQKISLMQQDTDPSIDETVGSDTSNYLIHLDNWTTVTNGSYNATTKVTTFANQSDWIDQVTSPNGALVLVDIDTGATRVGRYAECTVTNTDDFTVPGDWSTGTFYIGYLYEYLVHFPTFYLTQTQGQQSKSDVNSSLVVHRIKLNFGKSGLYETTLQRTGKADYSETYESAALDEYLVSDAPYLPEHIQTVPVYEANNNVKVLLKSSHPAPATLHALSWEGDYSPRNYRRV
tara:strand:- start:275 stop:3070 length:2796 start_codon:yes stop_codon:yes gene_type:complete